ncbi:Formamidopyrimidine-DNA glycosylase [Candidatus Hydrogenisulfobacillus filiaventi]|uniref:Formamidopyrimidine-DNA glycosylase n=1 Tax=Candidatus Hydrogenisulfobacillus filiaventi TaxID=2707344 RepID=A0A6F8ZG73_9FIRM|nr:bifunctional DNA-formamidopyrimidine glycosylase/DNA-(apurinic or apyrimidinic site) lyase [Bacillota bacterium]CAB1128636.1 Formamidopyrimidine-DNA glycosylase [Candidatus Hydrogenisulfobacillus filiaventi]
MPELPEVETIRAYLDPALRGRRIRAVLHLDPRMLKPVGGWGTSVPALRRVLTGACIRAVERRGKFLTLPLEVGGRLVLHLGMSGRLVLTGPGTAPLPHTHLVLEVAGAGELHLTDPRRFGRIGWLPAQAPEIGAVLGLGPEPLGDGWDAGVLARRLAGRRAPLKALLLDQRVVAGLGNIYSDEALFEARLAPDRPGGDLTPDEVGRLARAVVTVLQRSLAHGGTSFSDYVDALGHPGRNQEYLQVYGRAGKPCPACGSLVASRSVGGRTAHFCPACQGPGAGWAVREERHATV